MQITWQNNCRSARRAPRREWAKIKGNINPKNFRAAFRNKNLTLRYSRRNCKQTELIQIRGEPGAFSSTESRQRTQHCVCLYFFFIYIKVLLCSSSKARVIIFAFFLYSLCARCESTLIALSFCESATSFRPCWDEPFFLAWCDVALFFFRRMFTKERT